MSNKHAMQQQKPQAKPPEPPRETPEHKRCPCCHSGLGGEGKIYGSYDKGSFTRAYMRCDQCGHTWSADIAQQVVAINHRMPDMNGAR